VRGEESLPQYQAGKVESKWLYSARSMIIQT